ncbi:hypothetical protein M132_0993 [Bacteroides fragilis str. S24L15]|nr:hypothetical protein M067_1044 [Bacteroides fragilis str. J-143-4]EYA72233.1 hypothetical protein M132_0993 [Bacteroides fragilis str. S24L15]EYA76969.1 hypothetical protein M133_1053 [Bacteroides fragilis str. S24L26]OCR42026.1 hypothetical protein AC141_10980 [Bacteroides fragilis]
MQNMYFIIVAANVAINLRKNRIRCLINEYFIMIVPDING